MNNSVVLAAQNITAGYGGHPAINDITVELREDEVLCLIGHNGAGKSTLLKCLFGLLASESGSVMIDGQDTTRESAREISDRGVAMVPEGRGVFPSLSVRDIFSLGMHASGVPKKEQSDRVEWVLDILPAITEFMNRPAGTLSGGQQQMVSIGRALLNRPRILLMDEPSIGLAPKLFQDLLAPIRALQQREKLSILLVEQNVREALKISDRAVVMKSGAMIWEGQPAELEDNERLMELY
ncbi:ABC transporter ATP-binding protein [Sneathiella litorea]|uniref:ATP-binding cassette domain-containing protein n=1 Tax=Sneathiella litorea TaxID=2606216 RepID=A0A6L8WB94_9PROT|nr:ABC transporter ATP-binding protein [Sneathiella litorea]MZR32338.1 ATP-binding cassette domain-containing protein [Sneathiella litorea]